MIAARILGYLVGIGVLMAFLWPVWLLWCAVLQSFWPDGPRQLVDPSYWSFVGAWILMSLVGSAVFGHAASSKE